MNYEDNTWNIKHYSIKVIGKLLNIKINYAIFVLLYKIKFMILKLKI
jgi:hypothetical protein